MKTVNLNKQFTLLDGTCVLDMTGQKPEQMNQFIGNLLVKTPAKNDACLQLTLGQKIYSTKEIITLEKAEIDLIKQVLREAKNSALIEGQVLSALDEDVSKKKKG